MICRLFYLTFLTLPIQVLAADLYVKSLKAPLLKEARNGAETILILERNEAVIGQRAEGPFVEVNFQNKKGYMNKLFLSEKPLMEKGSLLDKNIDISSKARKRASGFTSAAAARGLKEDSDQIFKTLGSDVNPAEFKKMESYKVTDKDGLNFILNEKLEIKK